MPSPRKLVVHPLKMLEPKEQKAFFERAMKYRLSANENRTLHDTAIRKKYSELLKTLEEAHNRQLQERAAHAEAQELHTKALNRVRKGPLRRKRHP